MKLPQCFGSAVGSGCTCLPDVGCNYKHKLPAPAPEPKQGSEEPIDFDAAAKTANAWYYANRFEVFGAGRRELARAYLALRAEVEELQQIIVDTRNCYEAGPIRARLTRADADNVELRAQLAAEKARADRAEDAVRHSVHRNHKHTPEGCTGCEHVEAILAARASKEGGSR